MRTNLALAGELIPWSCTDARHDNRRINQVQEDASDILIANLLEMLDQLQEAP